MNQPLAFVHPSAKIAENVIIEPFAYIEKNVEIGEGTWIGPHTTILEGAKIADASTCAAFTGYRIIRPAKLVSTASNATDT